MERPAAEPAAEAGSGIATRRTGGSSRLVFVAAVLAGVGVVATMGIRSMRTGASAPPPPGAVRATGAPDDAEPASAAEPASEANARVPAWPDDPTLWREAPAEPAPGISATPPVSRPVRGATLEDVITGALPAVALVETPSGRGTGFFVAPDTLVTNAHVVESHAYVNVKLSTGEALTARVIQRSDDLDLAAIRTADARSSQATLPLASSREARVGQEVFAIGSPLGLQNTVTRGIVSALRQAGNVALVQTDAAINPGNSGGPILDRSGRVLAVATMRMGGRAEALGFGVGGEHVRALLDGRASSVSRSTARPADVFAPGRAEGADGDREDGEAAYGRFLGEAARRADQLDGSWREFVSDCLAGKAPPTRSDRGWYALWEDFDDSKVSPACVRFVTDFKVAARDFERRMTEAADRARRDGVYPGVCRQMRARHRLDSPAW